ncbi:hypothetical protein VTN00DRAFT_4116 [Thermoascus crustaceus]|uniref:uncharacterized protein n=1 Tax=Thermoascus crustaceus TaxID=5088 RepID=UPI0037444810
MAKPKQLLDYIQQIRSIKLPESSESHVLSLQGSHFLEQIESMVKVLQDAGYPRESGAFSDVISICLLPTDMGGLGHSLNAQLSEEQEAEILFLISAWLESLNSEDRSKSSIPPLMSRPPGRRAMTLTEKIFAMHDVERKGSVQPGDMVRVDVDWVIASEASWAGMEKTYNELGKPGIFRNDRFWLAGDHVVDPRVNHLPHIKRLIEATERAKHVFKMTDYQGMNYTILHTEFYRERAQPGMMIIGSDSHTCSSGALGCLAIGLGAADVTMPLVTGETWFKVPECVNIRLVGSPGPGIGGKDTILYILKELKKNTVAAERVVEFTGPGLQHLSCDARFAIANMTTEFGGITGIFVPDQITYDFINKRRLPRHKNASTYFLPDEDAKYAAVYEIDLSKVGSFLARYPSPDDVIPVSEFEGVQLDGCFIGACTTAEEDIILGALVLEQGLKSGLKPVKKGKRKVVPGSRPILHRLHELGLATIYKDAGFEIGIPGCSYCVGMSADRAAEGEVWISSQNRNFENRMGKGSIGHLASAATVAASSFEMKIIDPQKLLDSIDLDRWQRLKGTKPLTAPSNGSPVYVEPSGSSDSPSDSQNPISSNTTIVEKDDIGSAGRDMLKGKVQRLGDFIDTDALAPAQYLITSQTNEDIGAHCLENTRPNFRARVKEGFNIVVAGKAFGCGSSREQAVSALLGCGVQCVIAKSFAFIYARNQSNLGLLGIIVTDDSFYEAAQDGSDISIDLGARRITVEGKEFRFQLSQMEKELIANGGIASAFNKFGKKLFEVMCAPKGLKAGAKTTSEESHFPKSLQW